MVSIRPHDIYVEQLRSSCGRSTQIESRQAQLNDVPGTAGNVLGKVGDGTDRRSAKRPSSVNQTSRDRELNHRRG